MDRKAAVAGAFYPDDRKELKKKITGYIKNAKDFDIRDPKGVIVPHAGYIYSGAVAGYAYRLVMAWDRSNPGAKTVFVLGPAHYVPTTASIGLFDSYETPLGKVAVDTDICTTLAENAMFDPSAEAHLPEHSIEVQLPFLKESLKDFRIVPILLGETDPERLSAILQPFFGKRNTLFVFSSDLSHYLPYDKAVQKDRKSIETITGLKTGDKDTPDACGATGIMTAMHLAKNAKCSINLLDYRNSGDTAGDKSAVVGYAALAIS
jgi:AmmeMemoRadiSam system protein B